MCNVYVLYVHGYVRISDVRFKPTVDLMPELVQISFLYKKKHIYGYCEYENGWSGQNIYRQSWNQIIGCNYETKARILEILRLYETFDWSADKSWNFIFPYFENYLFCKCSFTYNNFPNPVSNPSPQSKEHDFSGEIWNPFILIHVLTWNSQIQAFGLWIWTWTGCWVV